MNDAYFFGGGRREGLSYNMVAGIELIVAQDVDEQACNHHITEVTLW